MYVLGNFVQLGEIFQAGATAYSTLPPPQKKKLCLITVKSTQATFGLQKRCELEVYLHIVEPEDVPLW